MCHGANVNDVLVGGGVILILLNFMVRLSLDLIEHSPVFTNAIGDRELDLRGILVCCLQIRL